MSSIELRSERGISGEDVGLLVRYRLAWFLVPLTVGLIAGAVTGGLTRSGPSGDGVPAIRAEAGVAPPLTAVLDREIADRRSRLAALRTSVVAFEATAGAPDPEVFRAERERAQSSLAGLRSRMTELEAALANARDASAAEASRLKSERLRTRARMQRLTERIGMLDAAIAGVSNRGESRVAWVEEIEQIEREIAEREAARADTLASWSRERSRLKAELRPSLLPRVLLGGLVGAFLGALVGAALMLWWHLRDSRVHTTRQLRAALNVPVLGTIPEATSKDVPSRSRFRRVATILAGLPRGI